MTQTQHAAPAPAALELRRARAAAPSRTASVVAFVRDVAPPILITLVALGIYAWIAVHVTSPRPEDLGFPPQQTRFERLAHWDGGWYWHVAQVGYGDSSQAVQPAVNFFPLFPGLTAALAHIVPALGLVRSGILINVAATCAAMVIVDRALAHLGWPAWQRWLTVAFLVTLPAAFFYTAFYSEALFVLAMALVLYGVLVEGAVGWAVAGAILGSLDRPPGALLALAVLFVLLPRLRAEPLRVIGLTALSLAGGLAILVFYWRIAGSPFAFVSATKYWQTDHLLYMGFTTSKHYLKTQMLLETGYHSPTAAGLWEWVVAVPLVALAWRFRPVLGALAAIFVLVSILMGGIDSEARFLAVILPLWIGVLGIVRRWPAAWVGVLGAIGAGLWLNFAWTDGFAHWAFVG